MALAPGLEDDEEEAAVAGRDAGEQAEAANRVVSLYAVGVVENCLDLL